MAEKNPKLCIIVPCYNEEETLRISWDKLQKKMAALIESSRIKESSRILFVDDGSQDSTWDIIRALHQEDDLCQGLKLTRNFGHQNAILAGLMQAADHFDCMITIDADLQHDIEAIPEFLSHYENGSDIVKGIRKNRSTSNIVKNILSSCFYRFSAAMGSDTPRNHADYRLMTARAVKALSKFSERDIFLRGLVPLLGFRQSEVSYRELERQAGTSKYSFGRMVQLALSGIVGYSGWPLRYSLLIGLFVLFTSSLMVLYVLVVKLFDMGIVVGWASTVIPIYVLGGLQMFFLGVVGEHIVKILNEVKDRPRYLIEEQLQDAAEDNFAVQKD